MGRASSYAILLRPLAWLYGLGVWLRNLAFDYGLLRVHDYPIPIICVGNITVGGTGKTPQVEYILRRLTPHYRVAVISRGYKRRTKGQIIAQVDSPAADIGDEPKQLKLKFPEVTLVVDANRRRAMKYLLALPETERPEVVVMDDGLQHRYIRPTYSMLLMDATRPFTDDHLLPEGRLREPSSARFRADCIVVTKCSPTLSPIQQRIEGRALALRPHQRVFFSCIDYQPLRSLTELIGGGSSQPAASLSHRVTGTGRLGAEEQRSPVLLIVGLGNPQPFIAYAAQHYDVVERCLFADHHDFKRRDIKAIVDLATRRLEQHPHLTILTTEKDAMRLIEHREEIPSHIIERMYYLPIVTKILGGEAAELDRILHRVARSRPGSLQTMIR